MDGTWAELGALWSAEACLRFAEWSLLHAGDDCGARAGLSDDDNDDPDTLADIAADAEVACESSVWRGGKPPRPKAEASLRTPKVFSLILRRKRRMASGGKKMNVAPS